MNLKICDQSLMFFAVTSFLTACSFATSNPKSQVSTSNMSDLLLEGDTYESAMTRGDSRRACQLLGIDANRFSEDDLNKQADALLLKFNQAGCASIVNEIASDREIVAALPDGISASITETIAWWNQLDESEKQNLTSSLEIEAKFIGKVGKAVGAVGKRVGSAGRVAGRVIFATIQVGDREGPARRAERERAIRELHYQRREGNRQIMHERAQREREIVAGAPDWDDGQSRSEESLDYSW